MKIVFITEGNPENHQQWSGTVCQIYSLLQTKHELIPIDIMKKRFVVGFVCRVMEAFAKLNGKKYIRTYSILKAKAESRFIDRELKKIDDVDIIFCPAKSGSIAFSKTKVPIVYLTDATFGQMIDYYPYLRNLCRVTIFEGNRIERLALEKANAIISASTWAKKSMEKDYNVEGQKIKVIPFGANLTIDVQKSPVDGMFHVIFCGVDWERKGGQIAVDTIRELVSRGCKVSLDIVGCNPPYEIVENYIHVHGFFNKNNSNEMNKLKQIYKLADVLLLPTKAECAGIVFAEASGYGIPCVTYDTGGIENYVHNGVNGYRLPPTASAIDFADKLSHMINNKELLEDLRRGAYALYKEKLNWTSWYSNVEELLNELCS